MNPHASTLDGAIAQSKGRAVHCAGCLRPFKGRTPQEGADRCREHERACPVYRARLPVPDPFYNARRPLPPVREFGPGRPPGRSMTAGSENPASAPTGQFSPQGVDFGGTTLDPALDAERLTKQLGRVYRALLGNRAAWLTLGEIAALTGDPEASISARLRDLRKAAFGGHIVERRARGARERGLWEYRLHA